MKKEIKEKDKITTTKQVIDSCGISLWRRLKLSTEEIKVFNFLERLLWPLEYHNARYQIYNSEWRQFPAIFRKDWDSFYIGGLREQVDGQVKISNNAYMNKDRNWNWYTGYVTVEDIPNIIKDTMTYFQDQIKWYLYIN